jgi:hypothetical protein
MNITKKNLRLVLRIAIIVMVIVGVIGQYFSGILVDKGWSSLLFYTTQSNLLVAATYLFLLIYELKDKKTPRLIIIFEHIAVSATTLTFIVFALFLGPYIANVRYFYSLQNLTLHNLVPILSIITYLIGKDTGQKRIIPFALISGFSYLIFAYLLYFLKVPFGSFEFPYFFMDFNQYGWLRIQGINFGVIYWWITIALLLYGISFLLFKLKEKTINLKKVPLYVFIILLAFAILITLINIIIKL